MEREKGKGVKGVVISIRVCCVHVTPHGEHQYVLLTCTNVTTSITFLSWLRIEPLLCARQVLYIQISPSLFTTYNLQMFKIAFLYILSSN